MVKSAITAYELNYLKFCGVNQQPGKQIETKIRIVRKGTLIMNLSVCPYLVPSFNWIYVTLLGCKTRNMSQKQRHN